MVACDQLIRRLRTFSIRTSWNTVPLRGAVLSDTCKTSSWEVTIPARENPVLSST